MSLCFGPRFGPGLATENSLAQGDAYVHVKRSINIRRRGTRALRRTTAYRSNRHSAVFGLNKKKKPKEPAGPDIWPSVTQRFTLAAFKTVTRSYG